MWIFLHTTVYRETKFRKPQVKIRLALNFFWVKVCSTLLKFLKTVGNIEKEAIKACVLNVQITPVSNYRYSNTKFKFTVIGALSGNFVLTLAFIFNAGSFTLSVDSTFFFLLFILFVCL